MNKKYESLFTPITIGELKIKNRIVRSATFELKAQEGKIQDNYLDFYKKLAQGGVGLIITGYGTVHNENVGDATPCLSTDDCVEGLSRLAGVVHRNGDGCKIAFQLCHIGRQYRSHNDNLLGPSAVREPLFGNIPREMEVSDIQKCIKQFALAIKRIKESGLDGVQLHAAHGWLLSTFLSPATNLRNDKYGGSTENRTRIMVEIINEARQLVGKNFPIMAKINASDFLENGIELEEAKKIVKILAEAGYDALEISSCMWATTARSKEQIGWNAEMIPEARKNILSIYDEGYHRYFASEIKHIIPNTPIMVVGGFRTPLLMDDVIASGDADMISMCRPFIREPGIPKRWERGDDRKADCISCNECLNTLHNRNLHCPLNKVEEEKIL